MSDLFNSKEYTRAERMRISRKITTDLTKRAIDYLNATGQFEVHRSNNIPSPLLKREEVVIPSFDKTGKPIEIRYTQVKAMFKKGNIKKKILDISGFTTGLNKQHQGIHIELEVKTGKDELDEGQVERIAMIKKAGGISFVFSDWETFLIQITPYLNERIPF